MGGNELQEFCALDADTKEMLKLAMTKLKFSAHAWDRMGTVARTIADLAAAEPFYTDPISEAAQYRSLDRPLWTCFDPQRYLNPNRRFSASHG